MHRIDSATRVVDKFGAGKDGFTEGTPGVTPATETTDDWFDGVQEEICEVIEKNNVALSKGTRDQLYTVLRSPVGEADTPAIAATVLSGDATAITGVGSGTGHGLQGTASGGANASVGVRGVGDVSGAATTSDGVAGVGAGTDGHGVIGTGAGTGPGVKGTASGASNSSVGVEGVGDISGAATTSDGGSFTGAGTDGHGVIGTGVGTGPGVKSINSGSGTASLVTACEVKALTSGDMASGFGVNLDLVLEDDASGELVFGRITAARAAADGNENLIISCASNGGGEGIFLDHQGYVGIGSYSIGDTLTAELEVKGNCYPQSDVSYDLGSSGQQWRDVYANDVIVTAIMDLNGGYIQGEERADVAAPAANHGVIYFRDNGGKTELVARFPTGAIQQIAIEP